jgi:hypothetical protein
MLVCREPHAQREGFHYHIAIRFDGRVSAGVLQNLRGVLRSEHNIAIGAPEVSAGGYNGLQRYLLNPTGKETDKSPLFYNWELSETAKQNALAAEKRASREKAVTNEKVGLVLEYNGLYTVAAFDRYVEGLESPQEKQAYKTWGTKCPLPSVCFSFFWVVFFNPV